ncbi:hypothetical protein HNQ91_002317 [Filimonas zeae]|uniref:Uncharacterized protein n=1 Tax=Filimonas zeae TaxID=1737353 RepID=A0A917IU17_9BACT|nr:hypothetical protein [Filimonas zeae]MDR6339266.1 hypothetical protein [Filimonas zeae]GGH64379.1 hypothetical protein GCM10011379_16360 [Filimonas zeae]
MKKFNSGAWDANIVSIFAGMPIYRVTVILFNGKGTVVLRQYEEDVDTVFWYLEKVVLHKYGAHTVREFEVVQLSKHSVAGRKFNEYLSRKNAPAMRVRNIAEIKRMGPRWYQINP